MILERGAALRLIGAGVRNGRRDDDSGAGAVTVSDLSGGHDPIYIYDSPELEIYMEHLLH